MTVDVKICGLTTLPALEAALQAGATYVGLVFYPPSPRHIEISKAAELSAACKGKAKTVALFVAPTDQDLKNVMEKVAPDFIQLHGHESPQRVKQVKTLTCRPIIKAIQVSNAKDTTTAEAYDGIADMILFDAKPIENGPDALPGGNGIAFDWKTLKSVSPDRQFMLSGGLNPDNVASAIDLTGASAVDVSSGVEYERGKKDLDLIRRFITNAKQPA